MNIKTFVWDYQQAPLTIGAMAQYTERSDAIICTKTH